MSCYFLPDFKVHIRCTLHYPMIPQETRLIIFGKISESGLFQVLTKTTHYFQCLNCTCLTLYNFKPSSCCDIICHVAISTWGMQYVQILLTLPIIILYKTYLLYLMVGKQVLIQMQSLLMQYTILDAASEFTGVEYLQRCF